MCFQTIVQLFQFPKYVQTREFIHRLTFGSPQLILLLDKFSIRSDDLEGEKMPNYFSI